MIAATISDAYLAPLIGASFVAVLGFMSWIVRMLLQISVIQAETAERLEHYDNRFDQHDQRLGLLERARNSTERNRYR